MIDEDQFYSKIYSEMQSRGLQGWYISKSHKKIEDQKYLSKQNIDLSILEVGGNVGEHIPYVKNNYKNYTLSDYRDTKFTSNDLNVHFVVCDVQKLPFKDNSYDRVISTCLLHHVLDPAKALTEMIRVTKPLGTVSILIPCDPGGMYRFVKWIGTEKIWKQKGIINPKFFHYSHHRNHFPGLQSTIEEIYKNFKMQWSYWPFKFRSWNVNLFAVVTIVKENNDR
jgi:ubiquinone/menaquinone biosynthesis C-methylase UbiE